MRTSLTTEARHLVNLAPSSAQSLIGIFGATTSGRDGQVIVLSVLQKLRSETATLSTMVIWKDELPADYSGIA